MTDRVNGQTSVYGLIGNPVSHSLSPAIHNSLARITGFNSIYVTFPVTDSDSLKKAIDGAHALGIKGMNVTVPYKKSVIPLLDEIDENALRIGAVNTLKYTENGYKGYNTDITGILRTFESNNICFKSQSLLILGAGGGAYAAAFAAAIHGASHIYIANRTNNNSELLARQLKKYYNNIEVSVITYDEISNINESYFILQTTTVGMDGKLSPVDNIDYIKKSNGVFDIIYSPVKTKILEDAEGFGKPFINGINMLICQAVRAFEIWNETEVGSVCVSELSERICSLIKAKSGE